MHGVFPNKEFAMKQMAAVIFSMALLLSITACGKSDAQKSGDQVSKPPVAVEVRSASFLALSDGIEVTGNLEPKFSVDVKTQIPGLVRQVMVSEWVPSVTRITNASGPR